MPSPRHYDERARRRCLPDQVGQFFYVRAIQDTKLPECEPVGTTADTACYRKCDDFRLPSAHSRFVQLGEFDPDRRVVEDRATDRTGLVGGGESVDAEAVLESVVRPNGFDHHHAR